MRGIYNNKNFIIKKKQLETLLRITKNDSSNYEVKEYFRQENELEEILKTNDLLEDVNIRCIGSLEHFTSRTWLFEYKGRGYVLWDNSNGHYSYLCTAEDFLYGLYPGDEIFNNEDEDEEEEDN